MNSPPPSTAHRQDNASMELINSTDVQILYHRRAILSREESATRLLSWRRWKDTIRGSLRIIVVTTSSSAHINQSLTSASATEPRQPSAISSHVPVRILLRKHGQIGSGNRRAQSREQEVGERTQSGACCYCCIADRRKEQSRSNDVCISVTKDRCGSKDAVGEVESKA